MRIVILGSGFGGFHAAVNLSEQLRKSSSRIGEFEITVVSESNNFLFKPSLIWVPFRHRDIDDISFELAPIAANYGVRFIHDRISQIVLDKNEVKSEKSGSLPYDYLVIATGGAPDWERIPGLKGNTLSIFDAENALEAKEKIYALTNGQSIVVGVGRDNPLPSVAYEFLFELDEYVKQAQIDVSLTFFTYEQMPLEKAGEKVSSRIKKHLLDKDILHYFGTDVLKVNKDEVHLSNDVTLYSSMNLIVPPYKGADFVQASKELEHEHGLVKVDQYCRAMNTDNVFAVGDAAIYADPRLAERFVKNGRSAERQGKYVAKCIANQIEGKSDAVEPFQDDIVAIWELGTDGAILAVKHPLAKRADDLLTFKLEGKWLHRMKKMFETRYLRQFQKK